MWKNGTPNTRAVRRRIRVIVPTLTRACLWPCLRLSNQDPKGYSYLCPGGLPPPGPPPRRWPTGSPVGHPVIQGAPRAADMQRRHWRPIQRGRCQQVASAGAVVAGSGVRGPGAAALCPCAPSRGHARLRGQEVLCESTTLPYHTMCLHCGATAPGASLGLFLGSGSSKRPSHIMVHGFFGARSPAKARRVFGLASQRGRRRSRRRPS